MQYPVAPDTTLKTWVDTNMAKNPYWYMNPGENYDQWRTRLENQYNADVANYNNYLQTAAFRKADLTSAGYNPNYSEGSSISPSAPGSYTTPEQTDSFAPLQRFLSMAGQASGISSQAIGSVLDVLLGVNNLKTSQMDRNTKSLANQVTNLGLWKLAGEIFGDEGLGDAMTWLTGGVLDIDAVKYPKGTYQYLTDLVNKGPFMTSLTKKLDLTEEQKKKITEEINKIKAETPGLEAKSNQLTQQNEWYASNQVMAVIMNIVNAIAKFL